MYFNPYAAGYRIQKLRKAHGLTQEEAAIKLNISDRHMRSLEKGTYAPLDLFVEIAVHFDVTLDYLILGKVETKTELALSKKINDQKQAMKSLRENNKSTGSRRVISGFFFVVKKLNVSM